MLVESIVLKTLGGCPRIGCGRIMYKDPGPEGPGFGYPKRVQFS